MKQHYFFLLILATLTTAAKGQQLPYQESFSQIAFLWNPAMTGNEDHLEFGAVYRRLWSEFEQSPKTTHAFGQVAIPTLNMGIGLGVLHEEIGLFQNSGVQLSYAYHLFFGRSRDHRLSIGLSANYQRFILNAHHAVGGLPADPLLNGQRSGDRQTNLGAGLYYTSRNTRHRDRNHWFAGLGVQQALPRELRPDANPMVNLQRAIHANGVFGARFHQTGIILEPSVWADYSSPNVLRLLTQVRLEWQQVYWASLGYSTDGAIHIGAGFIVDGGFLQDGQLRIGMQGSYAVGQLGHYQGLGYSFYLAYRYFLE